MWRDDLIDGRFVTPCKPIAFFNHPLEKVPVFTPTCQVGVERFPVAWQYLEPTWLPLFHGIEMWNRKVDGVAPSREAVSMLNSNSEWISFVGLDFHGANQLFPLSMEIEINGIPSEDRVIDAIRNRQCRALAFGISERHFLSGPLSLVATHLEHMRRFLSHTFKNKWMRKRKKHDANP